MRNILVICGKTASGKNLVRDILVEKYNYNPIITYTSRPPRKGEKQDITYHFISTDEFIEKIKHILELCLTDNVGAHIMLTNGGYRRAAGRDKKPVSVQEILAKEARRAARQEKLPIEQRLKPIYRKD